jgi:MFS family permease
VTHAAPDPTYRALARVPSVSSILASVALGRIAWSMASVVLVVFALERYDSPTAAGLVVFASSAPAVLMGPIAGALLDRHGRTRLVIVDYLAGASSMLAIGVLAATDRLPLWLLLALCGIASLTRPLSDVGLRTLLPLLVSPALWGRVNALDSNAFVVAQLLGPAAAGIALAVVGGPVALGLVAALLAAAAAALVRVPDPPGADPSGHHLLRDALDGLRYTWDNRWLRGIALSMVTYFSGFGVLVVAVPVVLLEREGLGPGAVGLAWVVMAIAGGLAAFLFGGRDSVGRERTWMVLGMGVSAVGTLAMLLPAGPAAVVVTLALIGLMQGPIDIGMFTLRQRRTDPRWFGRAFAVSVALNSAGAPIAAILAGVVLEQSVEAAVAAAALLFAGGALLAQRVLPGPGPEPQPAPSRQMPA